MNFSRFVQAKPYPENGGKEGLLGRLHYNMNTRSIKAKKALRSKEINENILEKLNFVSKEQYKMLRTNLQFTIPDDEKCSIIGVTSSIKGEGKSTVAINLSYVLAEAGKKVLLIDGDLRIPTVAKKLEVKSTPGLTDLLLDMTLWDEEKFRSKKYENWYVLPSGKLPPNPSELLGSKKNQKLMEMLSEKFDCIVIDLPPINLVSDALTLSNILTGMIVVVRENYVTKKEFDMCVRQLELSNTKVLGCVMNGDIGSRRYYKRYGSLSKYEKHGKYNHYYENSENHKI